MKKLLVAAAVAGAFSSAAIAADVTLYGVADVGLRYSHSDNGTTTTDKLQMMSGQNSGSRYGFKGSEDLGNGFKVSFQLEGQYYVDTGAMHKNGKLFRRNSTVTVSSDYGTVSAGMMGTLSAAAGAYDLIYGTGTAFDGDDGDICGVLHFESRRDNTIVYSTPNMGGVTGYAMYSLGQGTEDASSSQNERYLGIGLKYAAQNFGIALSGETVHFGDNPAADGSEIEDKEVYSLAANYDFGITKMFATAQYVKGADNLGDNWLSNGSIEGWALAISNVTPAFGGFFTAQVGYADAEHKTAKNAESDYDFTAYSAGLRYTYPFSKRTSLYGGVGYKQIKTEYTAAGTEDAKTEASQAYFGMTHKF